MNPYAVGTAVFFSIFAGTIFAVAVAPRLPPPHLSSDTRDVVKLGIGMVAAMTSLILGLMISSVKGSFDETNQNIRQFSTYIIMLDAGLRQYGPGGDAIRQKLKSFTEQALEDTWPDDISQLQIDDPKSAEILTEIENGLRTLSSSTADQRDHKSELLTLFHSLVAMRWKVIVGNSSSLTPILVVALTLWITLIFASFGVFSPRNSLAIATLFVCALAIATAMFLIIDMSEPFGGLTSISPAPMKNALVHQSK